MRQEVKPDENGSREGAFHLCDEVRRKPRKSDRSIRRSPSSRGIEMRITAPASDRREHARHNGDHHLTSTLRFRPFEQYVCDHSVAQQYQHERTHELTKTLRQHVRLLIPRKFCLVSCVSISTKVTRTAITRRPFGSFIWGSGNRVKKAKGPLRLIASFVC